MQLDDIPDLRRVRGSDSNSLLRLYDKAKQALTRSVTEAERAKVQKVVQRIAKELHGRDIKV
jgi:hypothetical protein